MPTNIKTLKEVGIVFWDTLPVSLTTLIGEIPYVPAKPPPQGAREYCYAFQDTRNRLPKEGCGKDVIPARGIKEEPGLQTSPAGTGPNPETLRRRFIGI